MSILGITGYIVLAILAIVAVMIGRMAYANLKKTWKATSIPTEEKNKPEVEDGKHSEN